MAGQGLERTRRFLERGDRSLLADVLEQDGMADARMLIVEAREAERRRLAQEVHDGPAQALGNAIFQVEHIDRLLDQDPRLARAELRFLRDLLRRELGDVRSFISQLRPPVLDSLGLDGAITDATESLAALTGLPIDVRLEAPAVFGDCGVTTPVRVTIVDLDAPGEGRPPYARWVEFCLAADSDCPS